MNCGNVSDSLVQSRLKSLDTDFCEAFRPNAPARLWLTSTIARNIKASRLTGLDAWDIIIEAYLRAIKFVKRGGLIWNLVSWLKTASTYIISEHRRKSLPDVISLGDMDCYWLEDPINNPAFFDVGEIINRLKIAISQLKPLERKLIRWRVYENLSWQEIQERISQGNESPPHQTALRKQKQRAIDKLHRLMSRCPIPSESDWKYIGANLDKLLVCPEGQ
jgi:DNA-directed RNA polymerase specialized sigma24 family protein